MHDRKQKGVGMTYAKTNTNTPRHRNARTNTATAARKRAAIYIRVSTSEQATRNGEREGYSIPYQREACMRRAEELGADVVAEYVDAGESAKTADRPQLKAFLERIRNERDIDMVIVHKLNRLIRRVHDLAAVDAQLEAAGCDLVSVMEHIDDTPGGKFMKTIIVGMAEFEIDNLVGEVSKGLIQKARNGGTPNMPPIGYLNVKKIVDSQVIGKIEFDPERAPLVKWLFEAYATGEYALSRLLAEATEKGLLQRATKRQPVRPLHVSQVHKILTNPYYVGVVTYRGVEYAGKHPHLIPKQTFDRVQEVLSAHNRSGERYRRHQHYLKGSLYCARCQGRMTLVEQNGRGGSYLYFVCLARLHYGCDMPYIRVDYVVDWISDHYALVQLDSESAAGIRDEIIAELTEKRRESAKELKRQTALVARLTRDRDKLLQAYYAGALPLDLFRREQERISRAIETAQVILEQRDEHHQQIERTVTEAIELAANWGRAYWKASDQTRRQLNQVFFDMFLIDIDGVAGARVTPAFRSVLSDDLVERFEGRRPERIGTAEQAEEGMRARKGLPPGYARTYAREPRELILSGVGSSKTTLVGEGGVEPPPSCLDRILNPARLPIPPLARARTARC
jgi:site-specific DNA recombinase